MQMFSYRTNVNLIVINIYIGFFFETGRPFSWQSVPTRVWYMIVMFIKLSALSDLHSVIYMSGF